MIWHSDHWQVDTGAWFDTLITDRWTQIRWFGTLMTDRWTRIMGFGTLIIDWLTLDRDLTLWSLTGWHWIVIWHSDHWQVDIGSWFDTLITDRWTQIMWFGTLMTDRWTRIMGFGTLMTDTWAVDFLMWQWESWGICNEGIYWSMQTVSTDYWKLRSIKLRFTGEEFEYKRWSDVWFE
jgi:hypothetical protein